MEFRRFELEEMFEEIKELLKYVEQNKLTDEHYMFFLGNDENLKYKLTKEAIPHLLGINTNYLISTGLYSSKNSYYLLEEMLDDSYRIYNAANRGTLDYNQLFSSFIRRKIKYFKENITIDIHNIDVVCKYIKQRTYTTGESTQNYDYIITKKYDDGKIGLLCLVFNGDVLAPISSQILETEQEKEETLSKLLEHQEISYISGIHMSDFTIHRTNITINEKLERLERLKNYKIKYNASVDVHKECKYLL